MSIHDVLQITFRGTDPSPAVEQKIRERAERLARFHERVTSCRVVVDAPHRHQSKGNVYLVRIEIAVPGHETLVSQSSHADPAHGDVYVAVRDAFDAADRKLEDTARRMRGDIKHHASTR